jgi:hypothetical protein
VFYCGAVHTQLRAAGACLQNSPPREGELHASGHTSSALDSIASSNLGRSKRFPPPSQNRNIQRRFHGRNTRGLLVRHRPSRQPVHAGDPAFNLHTVVSDTSQFVAHVTVENAGKQRFPVPCSLIDEIAAPPGQIYSRSEQSSSKWRKPPLCEAPGATAGNSATPTSTRLPQAPYSPQGLPRSRWSSRRQTLWTTVPRVPRCR